MIRLAKRYVLRSIDAAGYRLLKRADHEELLRARATPPAVPPVPPVPSVPVEPAAPFRLRTDEADFLRSVKGAGLPDLPLPRTLALFSAARYVRGAGVDGDVVDCGDGATATLTVMARAFLYVGDTSRRLVLFDTSADPLHRPELELEVWGATRDLLSAERPPSRPPGVEPVPTELASTGYPAEHVSIRRYPREAIAHPGPIAFLGLTAHGYEANRTAIATFLPRVSRGGVVAVADNPCDRAGRDAVDEFLNGASMNLLLLRADAKYRIGVRP